MSAENVAVVERAVEALQSGDPHDVFRLGLAAPDARWQGAQEYDGGITYTGADGFAEFIALWTGDFEEWTVRLTDVRDAGEKVLAFATQRAVGKGSGVTVEMDFCMLFTLRDGVITDTRAFLDRATALEAVGLPS